MTIKEILEEKIKDVGGNYSTYLAPNIPEKKLLNAANYIAGGIPFSDILAICDGTVFGSAKDGLVFTDKKFYAKSFSDVFSIEYENISKIKIEEKNVVLYSGDKVVWKAGFYNSTKLAQLLLSISANVQNHKNKVNQISEKKTETASNEKEKLVIEEKTPVKENITPIDFDTTINQHKLPLQTKLGEFDNFLGLKFGSNILENVFFLRHVQTGTDA